jgi:CRISPR-associated endonuclease/helicase Cas3
MLGGAPEKLLAKSRKHGELTVEQHCNDAERACARLFAPGTRWGDGFPRFFGVVASDRPRWLRNARVACVFHDIGKAQASFYAAVSDGISTQAVRHEHLSAILLHVPAVKAWLGRGQGLDHDAISAAVLSHHVKAAADDASDRGVSYRWGAPREEEPRVVVYFDHPEVRALLARVAEIGEIPGEIPALPSTPWTDRGEWANYLQAGMAAARTFRVRHARPSSEVLARKRFVASLKAAVVAADSAASGLRRERRDIDGWIDEAAHTAPISPEEIDESVIGPRITEIRAKRGAFEWQDFQVDAENLGSRALIMAGCGAGKTLAAWRWARAQARDHAIGKVIFLYPTRGTATEGFRDYVSWAPEAHAALMSGTARSELLSMHENPAEKEHLRRGDYSLSEQEERLYALGYWPRRFFSATVDQFLSFMEYGYKGLCMLPVLTDAAIIFDEVHSYDRHLFDNLAAFLKSFDVPALCMTATLPRERQQALESAGLRLYPRRDERARFADLGWQEAAPRYRMERVGDFAEAMQRAVAAYGRGERVLWVVNTVRRCQRLVRELAAVGIVARCYHSRYRLKDRKRRHEEVVAAFQQTERPAFAVTTQVCEMSLDLDADMLVTEYAPVTSLVQRFGRAHRSLRNGPSYRATLVVYPPAEGAAPYTRDDIRGAEAFLKTIAGDHISQRDLAEQLQEFARREPEGDGHVRFLDSGYYATPGTLRDIDGDRGVSAVCEGDLPAVRAAHAHGRPLDEWILPAPTKRAMGPTPGLPDWIWTVRDEQYSEELGLLMTEAEAT